MTNEMLSRGITCCDDALSKPDIPSNCRIIFTAIKGVLEAMREKPELNMDTDLTKGLIQCPMCEAWFKKGAMREPKSNNAELGYTQVEVEEKLHPLVVYRNDMKNIWGVTLIDGVLDNFGISI